MFAIIRHPVSGVIKQHALQSYGGRGGIASHL